QVRYVGEGLHFWPELRGTVGTPRSLRSAYGVDCDVHRRDRDPARGQHFTAERERRRRLAQARALAQARHHGKSNLSVTWRVFRQNRTTRGRTLPKYCWTRVTGIFHKSAWAKIAWMRRHRCRCGVHDAMPAPTQNRFRGQREYATLNCSEDPNVAGG